MTTAETSAAPANGTQAGSPNASSGLKIAALATGFVMATLDVTIINVAGATLQEKLQAGLTQLTWIVDGYILTFASLLMLAGGLANRRGPKTVYMWGMGLFLVASLACALSPSPEALIAARLFQGAGAALFMPSSLSLLVSSFPEKRQRTRMLGLWSAIVATSSGVGPTLGGLMVSAFGWQSIFLLNLPIGVIGMLMTRRFIAAPASRSLKLAVPGHIIWIVSLAAVSFALIEGPQLGWTAGPVVLAYAVAAVAAGALVLRERRSENLVMPWSLFTHSGFSGANLVGFFFNFALFGSIFMLGLFFQHAQGASPFVAGLELIPITILSPLANVVYSRISGRYANGPLLTVFLLVAGIASLAMTAISPSTPYWVIALGIGIANIGSGIVSPGMTAALVDAAGPAHANIAGSVLNANRQIGSLVGIAVIGVVLHATPDWGASVSICFLLVGVMYLLGSVCAWRLVTRSERRESELASA
ncbi:MFS transporter [Streptomyces caeruleatus]|uniref:MFS transporter n=1 Tax=Streptomyces caeruleatus TaxID=661399 RepID=A0A101TNQ3_9ACTN|nr:MFS transporter [Streptomyces caeruleatus]KUN95663.1 MFS transporter [Streptomyces caeruleatus]